ncbi:MAG: ADP-ribosylglycohydrolase family protein [Oscillospiraceae bacterium]
MTERQDKILGSLLAGAIGDAVGVSTETRHAKAIKERFGGLVRDFTQPTDDGRGRGAKMGVVTDDFSMAFITLEEIVKSKTRLTEDTAKKALARWMTYPQYSRYIGPTTLAAIARITGVETEYPFEQLSTAHMLCINSRATNGAGMKCGIMGLFNAGDLDNAIEETITMCMPTHDNVLALSAACAISVATAKAMLPDVSYVEVIQAGLYGARQGYKRAEERGARPVAGGSIEKRMQMAVEIGLNNCDDFEKAMNEIADIIGGGLYAYESIPAVFGHIAACKGRVLDSVFMGVNAGDDTDTVACMTGFIVGALNGTQDIPKKFLQKLNEMNGFDLTQMALDVDKTLQQGEI